MSLDLCHVHKNERPNTSGNPILSALFLMEVLRTDLFADFENSFYEATAVTYTFINYYATGTY